METYVYITLTSVHNNFIHCSRSKLETNQISINRRMDTQNIEYPYHGVLLVSSTRECITKYATAWMKLKSIMLSERNQPWKTHNRWFKFMWNYQKRKNYRDRKWVSGCRGWGKWDWVLIADCTQGLFGGDGSILKLDCENGCRVAINLMKVLILFI